MPQMVGNLSIRSKLLGLLAVPVAGAVLLGVAGVAAGWGERSRAADERRLATVTGQAAAAVHELQEERARAVAWTAGSGVAGRAELAARRRRVDRALAAYRSGAADLAPTGDPALDQAVAAAAARLDQLVGVRAEVDRRLLDPEQAAAGHDAMVAALLVVTRGLAAHLQAPDPARSARLLLALAAANEATGQEHTLLAATPAPGSATGADPTTTARAAGPSGAGSGQPPRQATTARAAAPSGGVGGRPARSTGAWGAAEPAVRVRLAAAAAVARGELNGVREAAGDRLGEIDRALASPPVRDLRRLELALLDPDPANRTTSAGAVPGDLAAWRDGLAARAGALWRVEREVAADLADASAAWSARQRQRLRDRLVLAALVVVATLAAALLALRALAGPRTRPHAAGAAVPGLARRGQALADRQLELLEDLARDEPDPLRRQGLAGAGHLAARLRRTAETLLAMAGEPARQQAGPVPLAAVLRAAVAEAEPQRQGQRPGLAGRGRRVDLLSTGEVEVEGPAATDLVHLLAELLDNAASFSPPTAPIVVTGAADGDDYLVEVGDRGLGMTDQELAWANQRLAGGGPGTPAAAGDRLGLLVAGRLAARNGVSVRLGRSPAGGVTAVVRIPADRLTTRDPVPARPA
jgi:signal transduction histidine kinase